ncbi:MAG: outer membrane lipoprotein-sorting protein [Pseudomonadales bacterium]|nr:outer membrane lipoprotein-sorting protein [Pseudomonadales bacterium]
MKLRHFFITLFTTLIISGIVSANEARTIIDKANLAAFYGGVDGRAEARMKITDGQGRVQYRQFTLLRKDVQDGGDQLFYVIFSRPSEVDRTAFLVAKHTQGDDDRWLYLPGLDLVKRIAAGDKRTSFVGSHFFYEDISGRNPSEDTYELLETAENYFRIQGIPKDRSSVEFTRYVVWIDKSNYLPIKAEYFDQNDSLYRRAETLKTETIQGIETGTVLQMEDLRDGGTTVTEMRFIRYNNDLPDTVFSERSLRTPPREWLTRK